MTTHDLLIAVLFFLAVVSAGVVYAWNATNAAAHDTPVAKGWAKASYLALVTFVGVLGAGFAIAALVSR